MDTQVLKEKVPTSFGPEESETVTMEHRMKYQKMKQGQMKDLTE